jgi:hypothetical protein
MNAPVSKTEFLASRPSVRSLARACAAYAISAYDGNSPPFLAKQIWPSDPGAEWLCRAAMAPTDTSAPGLTHTVLRDLLATLAPQSAAARIFREGLQLSFGRDAQISVPTLLGDPSRAEFTAEGYPIPVVQANVAPLTMLTPHKLACIVVLTAEMVRSSNAEALVLDALTRSIGLALDKAFLDDQPGDIDRPPGILYGSAPLIASTAPDPLAALMQDIENLHRAVAPVTASHPLFIMSTTRALLAQLRSQHGLDPLSVFGSYALRNTMRMITLTPDNLVSVVGGTPEISVSRESALQMDTAPGAGSAGRSLWQTDCVGVLLRLPITWGLRSSQGVAWTVTTNW